MENIIVKDIVEATGGNLICGDENTLLQDVCIDSRKAKAGDLFVPIIGENNDAHDYIKSALEMGTATLTSREHNEIIDEKAYIQVSDTAKALQEIGAYIRNRMDLPIIAITGSVGKTTTREMVAHALSTSYRTYETKKNFNSQIGVPITLCRMSKEDEIAILELGISEAGQMHILSELVKPSMAVVSVIGDAHIEFMKTKENIRNEKLKIIDAMRSDGTLILNGDDVLLADLKESDTLQCRIIYYGTKDWCDYQAIDIDYQGGNSYFTCVHGEEEISVVLKALGRHNVLNCMAALATAHENGISLAKAAQAFVFFEGQRQRVIEQENKYTIIDDTYNASPDSMKAGLNVLCDIQCKGRRIAVLGDMFELGENALKYHEEIGEFVASKKIDELIVIGELAQHIKGKLEENYSKMITKGFDGREEAVQYLKGILKADDVVLLKASNGMKFQEIVEALR